MFEELDIVVMEAVSERVNTGPVQFGIDWPGLFVRGDDATELVYALSEVRLYLAQQSNIPAGLARHVGLMSSLITALRATTVG